MVRYNPHQFVHIWEGRPFVHAWLGRVQRELCANSNKQSDHSPGGGAISPHVWMIPCILHLWVLFLYIATTLALVVDGISPTSLLWETPSGVLYLCLPILYFYCVSVRTTSEQSPSPAKRKRGSPFVHPRNCICPLCTWKFKYTDSAANNWRGNVGYKTYIFTPRPETPYQKDSLVVITDYTLQTQEVIPMLLILAGDVETNPGPLDLNLTNLSKELKTVTDPIRLAIDLGVPQHVIEIIQRDHQNDCEGQKIALFKYIADNCHEMKITWSGIADALQDYKGNLALEIRQNDEDASSDEEYFSCEEEFHSCDEQVDSRDYAVLSLKDEVSIDVKPCTVRKATYKGTDCLAVCYTSRETDTVKLENEKASYTAFLSEIASVEHPNIVQTLVIDTSEDFPVLAIENLESLSDYCASDDPELSEVGQLAFLLGIIEAILIFQDPLQERIKIKPGAIFVSKNDKTLRAKYCPMFGYSYCQQKNRLSECKDLNWIGDICKLLHLRGEHAKCEDLPDNHILKHLVNSSRLSGRNMASVKEELEKLHRMELARIDLTDNLSGTDLVEIAHVHMILLGHTGVGKTSLRKHFKNEPFDPHEKTTIIAKHEFLQRKKRQVKPDLLVTETLATATDESSIDDTFFFHSHNDLHGTETDKVFLTLWDTGGQPMFQDLLPCFPRLRSLYGITFRLDNFGDCANAEIRPSCDFEPTVRSPFTNSELICRCLAYIDTFSSSMQRILPALPSEVQNVLNVDISESKFPKSILIGTCKDEAEKLKVSYREKLEVLEAVVDKCELSGKMICPAETIAFEVDNTVSGRSEAIDPGMLDLRKSIVDFTQSVGISLPSSWLAFKLELEKLSLQNGIVPFDKVKSIAERLKINAEAVLVYFHEVGIFLWYHYSQRESLKKFVIVDPKKLLEVLAMIFNPSSFSEYRPQWKRLKEHGILESKLHKHLLCEKKTKSCLPESWVLDFLVEHHLAMPQEEGGDFFIPSMLQVAPEIPNAGMNPNVSALFIVPNSKYTPPGLFPRLVTILAGVKQGETCWCLPPRERKGSFCRNQVEFTVNNNFRIILTEFIDSIQVVCLPIFLSTVLDNDICLNILSTLHVQLQRAVPQWLNKLMFPFTFTFECRCTKSPARHFLPSLPFSSDNEVLCVVGEPMTLKEHHKIWLKKQIPDHDTEVDMNVQFKKAMADGVFTFRLSTILFCGTPAAGVTTLKQLFLNKQLSKIRHSTFGFEESLYYLETNSGELHKFESDDLRSHLSRQAVNPSMQLAITESESTVDKQSSLASVKESIPTCVDTSANEEFVESKPESSASPPAEAPHVPFQTATYEPSVDNVALSTNFEPTPEHTLTQLASTTDLVESMTDTVGVSTSLKLIRVIDCGTNPVFLDTLPHFVQNVTVSVPVINLSQSLNDHPTVSYFNNGSKHLQQVLSPYTNNHILHLLSNFAPNVTIVGSHADVEMLCSESRATKNQVLSQRTSFKHKLIQSGDEPIFPFDAKSPQVHSLKETLLATNSPSQQKQTPYKWQVLLLKVDELMQSQKRKVLSRTEIVGLAEKLDPSFTEESLDSALAHFHQLGMIFDILPNVVFGDITIFSNIVGNVQRLKLQETNEHVTLVTKTLFDSDFSVEGLFTASEIIQLFIDLFILIEVKNPLYLIPCLSVEKLKEYQLKSFRAHISPLLLCYPKAHGIFSALACFLTSPSNTHPWPWRIHLEERQQAPSCVYRNCIQLIVPRYKAVVNLIDSSDFLEVYIENSNELCAEVRAAVCSGLTAVFQRLHYFDFTFEVSFLCECGLVGDRHAVTNNGNYWTCSLTSSTGKLKNNQKVWLGSSASDDSEMITLRNAFSKLLPASEKWQKIGSCLGLDSSILNDISVWHRQDPDSALFEVTKHWFSQCSNPQWTDVLHALKRAKSRHAFNRYHPFNFTQKDNICLSFGIIEPKQGSRDNLSGIDVYSMNQFPHGLAVLINNEKFDSPRHHDREGSMIDFQNLIVTFRYLGYIVETHNDCTADEMTEIFERLKNCDHSCYDSFVCHISSNSSADKIVGCDGKNISVASLVTSFYTTPTLVSKPKLFFFEGCRGRRHLSCDDEVAPIRQPLIDHIPPNAVDVFIGYSTHRGYVSFRDLDNGCWYTSELCRMLCTHSTYMSLENMMKVVERNVYETYEYNNSKKQAPESLSTLRKQVYF